MGDSAVARQQQSRSRLSRGTAQHATILRLITVIMLLLLIFLSAKQINRFIWSQAPIQLLHVET